MCIGLQFSNYSLSTLVYTFLPMAKAHISLSYPHQTSMNISVELKTEVMIIHFSNVAIHHLTICLPHLLRHTNICLALCKVHAE